MNVLLPILISLLLQAPIGPEDAFRANFAAIHAKLEYSLRAGDAPFESVKQLRSGSPSDVSFVERPQFALNIEWACDGVAQRIACISANPSELVDVAKAVAPPDGLSRGPVPGPPSRPFAEKGFEVLWDDEIQVEHRFDQPDAQVHMGGGSGILYTTAGPFLLWANIKYPSHIKTIYFPKSVPAIHRATLGGRDLVVAVYQDEFEPDGWARLEIWHDPKVGYLPRFARYVVGGPSWGTCKEYFLMEARPCVTRGFVPTRVYEANFDIDRPQRLPASEFDSHASPPIPRSQIHLRRLEATEFKGIKGPVGLEKLENVETIAASGGTVPLTNKNPLTIDRVKAMLGGKLTEKPSGGLPPPTSPN